jgi:hypothetical protein
MTGEEMRASRDRRLAEDARRGHYPPDPSKRSWLDPIEAADVLGISPRTLVKWCAQGKVVSLVHAYRHGCRKRYARRIPKTEVARLLSSRLARCLRHWPT